MLSLIFRRFLKQIRILVIQFVTDATWLQRRFVAYHIFVFHFKVLKYFNIKLLFLFYSLQLLDSFLIRLWFSFTSFVKCQHTILAWEFLSKCHTFVFAFSGESSWKRKKENYKILYWKQSFFKNILTLCNVLNKLNNFEFIKKQYFRKIQHCPFPEFEDCLLGPKSEKTQKVIKTNYLKKARVAELIIKTLDRFVWNLFLEKA